MQTPVSLKSAERRAFQSTFADGLWDVFIGCFALEFAIAPLLSETLGDFWSSAIFLPIWGLVYLAIWLVRKHVLAPRLGTVSFGKARQRKMRKFSLVLLVVNVLMLVLGVLAVLNFGKIPGIGVASLFSLFLLAGFSAAAYMLDHPRLYFYGLLLFVAPLVGEWLYANHGVAHHGYPVVFGIAAGIMILTGLALFVRVLINHPAADGEGA
jgi:hypothetical protein